MTSHAMIRMIALDLDGTLLTSGGEIEPRAAGLIESLRTRLPIVIVSARPPRGVRSFFDALRLDTPIVCYNGAMSLHGDTLLEHLPLDAAVAAEIVRVGRSISGQVCVSYELLDTWLTDRVDMRFVPASARLAPPNRIMSIDELARIEPTKIMLHGEPALMSQLESVFRSALDSRATMLRTDPHLLQFVDRRVDKARSLRMIAGQLGVEMSNVLAVGDNANDVGMLRECGVGVAVANATPDARAAADWVSVSNDDAGVAQAIEKFVLGEIQ